MDPDDFSNPVEVWLAAEGEPSQLVSLLLAEGDLAPRTRHALAAWLSGAFGPTGTPDDRPSGPAVTPDRIRRETALANYLRVAAWISDRGYQADTASLSHQIANKWHVPPETLRKDIDRARSKGLPDIFETEARAFRAWRRRRARRARGGATP